MGITLLLNIFDVFWSCKTARLGACAGVRACCGDVNSETLEALHKRAGRIVVKTSSSDVDIAMEALKLPSLRSRLDEQIFTLVRKCIDGRCPQFFKNYFVFNKDICASSTCQSKLLLLLTIRTEVARRSFYYYGTMYILFFSIS